MPLVFLNEVKIDRKIETFDPRFFSMSLSRATSASTPKNDKRKQPRRQTDVKGIDSLKLYSSGVYGNLKK